MASPAVLAPPVSTFIEPSRNGKFRLQLSKGLQERKERDRRFWSVKYNHKPRQPQDVVRTTTLKSLISGSESPTLTIVDHDETFGGDTQHEYRGRQTSHEDSYALLYDSETKVFTLEALAANFAFNLQTQVDGDVGHEYGDATANGEHSSTGTPLRSQDTIHAAATNGHDAQTKGGIGTNTPGSSPARSDQDDGAPADPKNPFDYRHYISGLPGAPEKDPGASHTPLHESLPGTPHQGPMQSPAYGRSRTPSTLQRPTLPVSSPLAPPSGTSLSKIAQSASQVSSDTPTPGPTRIKKRKAPANAALRPMTRDKQMRASSSNPDASNATATTTHGKAQSSSTSSKAMPSKNTAAGPRNKQQRQPSNPNDLIIEGSDDEHDHFPNYDPTSRNPHSSPLRPQSLREIAASRNASPAVRYSTNGHATANKPQNSTKPRSSSNLAGLGISNDTSVPPGRKRSGTLASLTNASVISLNGTGTDADVETDLELGSPEWDVQVRERARRETPRVVVDQDEVNVGEDDDSDGEVLDEFDRAIQEAIEASDVGEGSRNGSDENANAAGGDVSRNSTAAQQEEEESEEE